MSLCFRKSAMFTVKTGSFLKKIFRKSQEHFREVPKTLPKALPKTVLRAVGDRWIGAQALVPKTGQVRSM